MGEQEAGRGWVCGARGRLHHSLLICDCEKLSRQGEAQVVTMSSAKTKEQETGSEAAVASRLVFREDAVC